MTYVDIKQNAEKYLESTGLNLMSFKERDYVFLAIWKLSHMTIYVIPNTVSSH